MGYKWKTTPYKHQVRAVKFLLRNGYGGALLMEPRTGKTKTTIDYASILNMQGKIDRMIVVCPARVMGVWIDELHAHSPRRVNVVVWDAEARQGDPPPVSPYYDLTVLIVNYEAFSTPGKKLASGKRSRTTGRFKNRARLIKWMQGKPTLCVLDESHKIKSASSKAATMIVSMRDLFAYRVILTGTPVTKAKRVSDIYMQWKFLNPLRFKDLPTFDDFKNEFGQFIHANGYPQWVRGRNLDKLKRRVHQDAFSVKRSECYDLPPAFPDRIVKIRLRQSAKAYDDMAEDMVHKIETGEITEASIKLTQALRLAQITSGCAGVQDVVMVVDRETGMKVPKMVSRAVRIGTEKLDALEDILVDEVIEKEEKVVVCARFKADLTAIEELCHTLKIPVYVLRGGMKRQQTDEAIREFRKVDGAAVFVLQPAAGSMGIDLSTASHMVWYSLDTKWVDYSQACDRIALSQKGIQYTYLIAEGTVDELLYQTLQEDGDVGKAILDRPQSILRAA